MSLPSAPGVSPKTRKTRSSRVFDSRKLSPTFGWQGFLHLLLLVFILCFLFLSFLFPGFAILSKAKRKEKENQRIERKPTMKKSLRAKLGPNFPRTFSLPSAVRKVRASFAREVRRFLSVGLQPNGWSLYSVARRCRLANRRPTTSRWTSPRYQKIKTPSLRNPC